MTDAEEPKIVFRVRLDHFDIIHPHEKQTSVYVSIPGIGSTNFLLPPNLYYTFLNKSWPEILHQALNHWTNSTAICDSRTQSVRQQIRNWFRDPDNNDELQSLWEWHEAGKHPLVQKVMQERDQLRKDVDVLTKEVHEANSLLSGVKCLRDSWIDSQDHRTRIAGNLLHKTLTRAVLPPAKTSEDDEPEALELPRELAQKLHDLLEELLYQEDPDEE